MDYNIENTEHETVMAPNTSEMRTAISRRISSRLQYMMEEFFKTHEHFYVCGGKGGYEDMTELPEDLCQKFGLQFTGLRFDNSEFVIFGKFVGKLADLFNVAGARGEFHVVLANETCEQRGYYGRATDFKRVQAFVADNDIDIAVLASSLNSDQVALLLSV